MATETRIEKRVGIRENHEEVWSALRKKFEGMEFPEQEITEKLKSVRTSDGSHREDGEKHRTIHNNFYEPMYEFFGIDWSYDFCPQCKKIVKKQGVLTNQIESEAVVKDFMNQPQRSVISNVVGFFAKGVTDNEDQ